MDKFSELKHDPNCQQKQKWRDLIFVDIQCAGSNLFSGYPSMNVLRHRAWPILYFKIIF